MKRLLAVGKVSRGTVLLFVSDAKLVARGYFFPTYLQRFWAPDVGPWRSKLSAISKN